MDDRDYKIRIDSLEELSLELNQENQVLRECVGILIDSARAYGKDNLVQRIEKLLSVIDGKVNES